MDYVASLFDALSADATLTALLDTFDGGPAIFTGESIPPEDVFPISAKPYVWIHPTPVSAENVDTLSSVARLLDLDVCLYALTSESSGALHAAAERARVVLHRVTLPAASGESPPFCTVSGPLPAPTSEATISGRRLAARLTVKG